MKKGISASGTDAGPAQRVQDLHLSEAGPCFISHGIVPLMQYQI
jgi:hypothetical protein